MYFIEAAVQDPTTFLFNYGTLGIVVVLLLTGWLYTKPYVMRMEKELEQKDKIIDLLTTTASNHTIPALATTARVMEAVPTNEAQMLDELRTLRTLLEQNQHPGGGG